MNIDIAWQLWDSGRMVLQGIHSHWVQALFRTGAGLAGALLVYAAIFLYEDEQGKIQNRLEDWWVRVSDAEKTATSRYAVFMREVAKAATGLFDRLFGPKLVSWRALRASAAYSTGSFVLFMVFDTIRTEGLREFDIRWLLLPSVLAGGFYWYGSHRLTIRQPFRFLIHLLMILIFVVFFFGFFINYGNAGLVAVFGSFLCDIGFIAATRQTLRWCSQMERLIAVVLVILINCAIAFAFVVGPAGLYYHDNAKTPILHNPMSEELQRANWFVAGVSFAGLNAVDALAASVFVVLAIVAGVHRVLWPVLGRGLYALQGIGIARRRSLMATVGVALLTHAGVDLPAQFKKIVELFSG
jgi:hypothetical protein